ncbi:MAG: hypothetical protein LBP56_04910 [Odoribacteraceae bacterium]|jgi:C-terminal processing protease CtpA/Prc|nr:hypothetical protein [Odoribacteraceae bacterium]
MGIALWGCADEGLDGGGEGEENTGGAPTTPAGEFNAFLRQEMTDIYFWADKIRGKAFSLPLDTNSQWYFNALKYTHDPWSYLTGEAFEGELAGLDDGHDTGFGWILTLWSVQNEGLFAKINYIYPRSPAAEAGAQRGEKITRIDGEAVSEANVYKLLNTRTAVTVQLISKNATTRSLSLTPRAFDIQPIAKDTVIVHDGQKIGYLFYTSFVYQNEQSLQDLTTIFTKFKQAGVTEFILDLRYNGGGYVIPAIHLASLLAPERNVSQRDVLINKIWNAKYQEQFAGDATHTTEYFDNRTPATARLGLSRVWVLTSANTASASEIVISGLRPYMTVYTVGEVTAGKNAGGSVFSSPGDTSKEQGAYLITMQYTNKDGESVAGGIPRTYGYDANKYYNDTTRLGDPNETFIAVVLRNMAAPGSRGLDPGVASPVVIHGEIGRSGRLIVNDER